MPTSHAYEYYPLKAFEKVYAFLKETMRSISFTPTVQYLFGLKLMPNFGTVGVNEVLCAAFFQESAFPILFKRAVETTALF